MICIGNYQPRNHFRLVPVTYSVAFLEYMCFIAYKCNMQSIITDYAIIEIEEYISPQYERL